MKQQVKWGGLARERPGASGNGSEGQALPRRHPGRSRPGEGAQTPCDGVRETLSGRCDGSRRGVKDGRVVVFALLELRARDGDTAHSYPAVEGQMRNTGTGNPRRSVPSLLAMGQATGQMLFQGRASAASLTAMSALGGHRPPWQPTPALGEPGAIISQGDWGVLGCSSGAGCLLDFRDLSPMRSPALNHILVPVPLSFPSWIQG